MIDLLSLAELPLVTHPVTITGRDVRFARLLLEVTDVIFNSAAVTVEHSNQEQR